MKSELRRVKGTGSVDHPLLHVAMGLLSTMETFDRILQTHAAAGTERDPVASEAIGIDALLGIIAFRDRLRAAVEATPLVVAADGCEDRPSGDLHGEELFR